MVEEEVRSQFKCVFILKDFPTSQNPQIGKGRALEGLLH